MNILELNIFLIIIYAIFFLLMIRTKSSQRLFVFLATSQMIIFNGLRNVTVGTDSFRYKNNFFEIQQLGNFSEFISINSEIGYTIAQKIFTLFSKNFNLWIFVVSVFIFTYLGLFIYKYSKGYFISYLLFIGIGFYDFSFTGIKQSIAMIIVLYSYKYILNKSFLKFLIVIVIATMFHLSAIVFLPMYFIARVKWKKIHISLFTSIFGIIYVFRFQLGKILTNIYYEEAASIMLNKYSMAGTIGGLSIMIILVVLWGVFVYNPLKYRDEENIVLTNILVVSAFIQMLSSFSYLFTRLNMYYMFFLIIYIPNVLNNIEKIPIKLSNFGYKLLKIIIKIAIITVMLLYYKALMQINGSGILPYSFFWK